MMHIIRRSILRQRERKGLTHSDSFGIRPEFSHIHIFTHLYLVVFCCSQEAEKCYAKSNSYIFIYLNLCYYKKSCISDKQV